LPSDRELPTLDDLRAVFRGAVASRELGECADTHTGAIYDCMAGMGAMVWRAIAERDQAAFRTVYLDGAKEDYLDVRALSRLGATRIESVPGTGEVWIERAGLTEGTIWKGTRIALSIAGGEIQYFEASSDYEVLANVVEVKLPIQQATAGQCGEVDLSESECTILRIDDPLWDTWNVTYIACSAGTVYEQDRDYLARGRADVLDARVGFPSAIEQACRDAGAARVVLFAPDFGGIDTGLSNVVVGDSGGSTPDGLLSACRLALAQTAILGVNAQILPMTRQAVAIQITVSLWTATAEQAQIASDVRSSVLAYFETRQNPFLWTYSGIRTAAFKALRNVHEIVVTGTAEPSEATLLVAPVIEWEALESGIVVLLELAA